ncbi:uncharacterized protein BDR25DRAFT_318581 [Lindgomyces ingoldianus]|uniref:Uncharacterized protein n=1 Tax=Lindgomyces ingoldianus TaxID=673940 RepID=A0ACB6QEK3_9PLEO|nr:uncharacterized protein BDR25DRAFT_318581 [Lindgomyces ingoldianus]KAF2465332.1 hypothetical protein BDR25DRAFT_318581 [Lindgomyces ingoldianus]
MASPPIFIQSSQTVLEYTQEQREKKAVNKRTAAAELQRINAWKKSHESDPRLKPLPPIPDWEMTHDKSCKRIGDILIRPFKRRKKSNTESEDVDFSVILGSPLEKDKDMGARRSNGGDGYGSGDESDMTALPQSPYWGIQKEQEPFLSRKRANKLSKKNPDSSRR